MNHIMHTNHLAIFQLMKYLGMKTLTHIERILLAIRTIIIQDRHHHTLLMRHQALLTIN